MRTDTEGTPVALRAKQEKRTPQEVSDFYHEEFAECFDKLGFSYDVYTKTSSDEHKKFVREFHKKLYESKLVYEKEVPQAYCESCFSWLFTCRSGNIIPTQPLFPHLAKDV